MQQESVMELMWSSNFISHGAKRQNRIPRLEGRTQQIFPLGLACPGVRIAGCRQETPDSEEFFKDPESRESETFQMASLWDNVVYSRERHANWCCIKKEKIRWQIHICSLLTNKPQQVSRHKGLQLWFRKAVFTKQWILIPSPKDGSASRRPNIPHKQFEPAAATLSASFLVTKLTRRGTQGWAQALPAPFSGSAPESQQSPFTRPSAPRQTAVFSCKSPDWWNLFSGYCSRQLFLWNTRAQAEWDPLVWMSEQAQPKA